MAWLAGLLEGEGCFSINDQAPHRYPVIRLEMATESVVARAATLLGSSIRPNEPRVEDWSTTYVAAIAGAHAAEWMLRLRSSMGARRAEAIDAALMAYAPIRLVDPPITCVVPDCGEPHRSRGLCHKHYMSWLRDVRKGREPRVTPVR